VFQERIFNDGDTDFLLKSAGFKTFSLYLGGPNLNNINLYGMKGLLEAFAEFPGKAISCADQSGDGVKDFVVTANPYSQGRVGYVIIYRRRDDIHVGVEEEIWELPFEFKLEQNYPNPFNPLTILKYNIPDAGFVELTIYDVLGEKIFGLVNEFQQTGSYKAFFNASGLASGIYFYQ